MRLFVIGATGRTGREILHLARRRGHLVTAFVRSPGKLSPAPGLTIVAGDPLNATALAAALPGHDAVLSSIGPSPREAFRPGTLLTDSARATIQGMHTAGVDRLAIVSAAVLFPQKGAYFAFFRWLLRHHARDLNAMEALVGASGLSWTIARPPRLVQAADTGFRALEGALPPGSFALSYGAVATFLLDAVESGAYRSRVVGLGRPLAVAA